MSDSERIRLAEAMGWTHTVGHSESPMSGRQPFEHWSKRGGKVYDYLPFNPFTDANDDYAVLEWMRENWKNKQGHHGHWHQSAIRLWHRWDEYSPDVHYQIGDYARAALKVIEDE